MTTESITLSQHLLGMNPYVLIEADTDPADGELVLKVKAGGGAAEEIGYLPFLMLAQLPPEQSPIITVMAELLDEHPEYQDALSAFAERAGIRLSASDG